MKLRINQTSECLLETTITSYKINQNQFKINQLFNDKLKKGKKIQLKERKNGKTELR